MQEGLHLDVCLFAKDEESDLVVCLDLVDVVYIGSYELEHKHYVVSSVQILLLILDNRSSYSVSFLRLLLKFSNLIFDLSLLNTLLKALHFLHWTILI